MSHLSQACDIIFELYRHNCPPQSLHIAGSLEYLLAFYRSKHLDFSAAVRLFMKFGSPLVNEIGPLSNINNTYIVLHVEGGVYLVCRADDV